MKKCSRCSEIKQLSDFYKSKNTKDGYLGYCKVCDSLMRQHYYKSLRLKPRSVPFEKSCKNCNITKPSSEFYASNFTKDGLSYICGACERQSKYQINSLIEQLVNRARHRAKKQQIPFDIDAQYIKSLIVDFDNPMCPVLNTRMVWRTQTSTPDPDRSISLDRIVPSLGYVRGNVAIISMKANRIKNNATLYELEQVINWLKQR